MKVPLLDLKAQYAAIRKDIDEAIKRTLDTASFIMSPEVKALEEKITVLTDARNAVGVANGTDALVLILDALGIGTGDEVITTPFTFFATAEAISRVGAKPVFADIDDATMNIAPAKAEELVNNRTKAIMAVHIFGLPADMDALNSIAERNGLIVIEDACQAIGARYKGKRVGSLGEAAAFSFFPSKNLGCAGDGGAVTTDNDELAAAIRSLRTHGTTKKYYHDRLGYNSRLDSLQAAILNVKADHIDGWNAGRRKVAAAYDAGLAGLPLKLPVMPEGYESVYHLYTIRTGKRDGLMQYLQEHEIGCGIYYPLPLHLQEVYRDLDYKEGSLPVSESASREALSIPIYPELTEEQAGYVIETIKSYFK